MCWFSFGFICLQQGLMYPRLVSIHYVNEDDLELPILKSPTLELQECATTPGLSFMKDQTQGFQHTRQALNQFPLSLA